MKIKARRNGIQPNVDMTPMIDIVFQLILFFLVSTTFAIVPSIKLNLPTSHTSEGSAVKGITIYAQEDESLFFNDEPVSLDSLGLYLSSYDTGDVDKKEFPVTLQADSNVTHGTIVKLLDIARENGYSIVNLRTATEE
ncbi:MAG: biopolymer transporter ExbD [Treponema sp.]|nr:biopolymer transporter ExbD [Treponema sp.]MCI5666824.1 biopolymer transporter ExbD [Spirochaetia bacterium]MDD7768787.1 biopolymer transporter ExbD [Treponema sp.]MDY3132093.1 biopolymer transporter ExbD [Treponema sp.]